MKNIKSLSMTVHCQKPPVYFMALKSSLIVSLGLMRDSAYFVISQGGKQL